MLNLAVPRLAQMKAAAYDGNVWPLMYRGFKINYSFRWSHGANCSQLVQKIFITFCTFVGQESITQLYVMTISNIMNCEQLFKLGVCSLLFKRYIVCATYAPHADVCNLRVCAIGICAIYE